MSSSSFKFAKGFPLFERRFLSASVVSALAVDVDDRGPLAQCGIDASKSFFVFLAVDVGADAPI